MQAHIKLFSIILYKYILSIIIVDFKFEGFTIVHD